jgi:hypothetical protein
MTDHSDPPSYALGARDSGAASPEEIAGFESMSATAQQLALWFLQAVRVLREVWEQTRDSLAKIDWVAFAETLQAFQQLVPQNFTPYLLMDLGRLEDARLLSVPLAWVVPAELVPEFLEVDLTDTGRLALASTHRDEILAECSRVLEPVDCPAAEEARDAVRALSDGHVGPAQSHAANIIDSVVLAVYGPRYGRKAREEAIRRATTAEPDPGEVPVRASLTRIVLGPLIAGYAQWYPDSIGPLPTSFGRHVTAHGAHLDGVFSPEKALVAVMLATSLVMHFRDDLALGLGPGTVVRVGV